MLNRIAVLARENLLVIAVLLVGLTVAAAIGFAAGSASAASYAGLVLGLAVGAAIAYSQRRRSKEEATGRRGDR